MNAQTEAQGGRMGKREQLLDIMEEAAKGETKATLRDRIAELEAENERLTRERDIAHEQLSDVTSDIDQAVAWERGAKTLREALQLEREARAEALSRTGAVKVDRQRLNMEISRWATDSDLHITIGDVEALHEAILSALEPAAPEA